MRKFLKTVTAGLLLAPLCFFSGAPMADAKPARPAPSIAAASQEPLRPALWVLKDEDTTIYLFGTIHALRGDEPWFSDTVRHAFEAADTLVLEIIAPADPVAMHARMMEHAIDKSGKTLSSRLSPDERTAYHAALAAYSIPPATFDRFHPWYAGTVLGSLPTLKAGYDPAKGVEARLTALAVSAGKSMDQLESVDQQFGAFNHISEADQLRYLNESVHGHEQAADTVDELVLHWRSGEPEAIAALMHEALKNSPEFAEILLYRRNEDWAAQLEERLKMPGTQFVAVGAGHLSGDRSVQDYLAARGLIVERIEY